MLPHCPTPPLQRPQGPHLGLQQERRALLQLGILLAQDGLRRRAAGAAGGGGASWAQGGAFAAAAWPMAPPRTWRSMAEARGAAQPRKSASKTGPNGGRADPCLAALCSRLQ